MPNENQRNPPTDIVYCQSANSFRSTSHIINFQLMCQLDKRSTGSGTNENLSKSVSNTQKKKHKDILSNSRILREAAKRRDRKIENEMMQS